MSAEYAYDLYPRDDPRDGARLVRYTYEDLIAAEYRDVIGVGAGQATIWADHAGAEQVDVRGEQYIRVVRLGGAEAVVGGIWTSKLPFETAVASERRHLTMSGPGQMAYIARARMAPHTYISPIFTGQDPFDGLWRLSNQSTFYANGPYLGAMLWRVIYEAQHFTPGSHKHADGIIYTDTHADDRTVSRIPDLVLGFDQFEDSDGNAWTLTAGEFSAQVGENVLGVVQRLMQAGLSVWMDPNTFTLYAWEGRPATKLGRSTDRTGAAWGASVVRFQYPTDGTTATGNVLSETTRVVNAYLPQGPIWVGGNDIYHKETGPADALYEGFVNSTAEDLAALAALGAAQSTARSEASDVGQVKHRLGDVPANGAYLPGEHYLLDELVRINTGSGEFDYDEDDYPVGAWRVSLPEDSAEWVAHIDLGASFEEARAREFAIASTAGCNCPPHLCVTATVPPTVVSSAYGSTTPSDVTVPAGLTNSMLVVFGMGDKTMLPFVATYGGDTMTPVPSSSIASSGNAGMHAFYILNPTEDPSTIQLNVTGNGNGQYKGYMVLKDVDQSNPIGTAVTATGTGTVASLAIGGSGLAVNGAFKANGGSSANPTPGGGQTSAYVYNGVSGLGNVEVGGGYGGANPTWTFSESDPWAAIGFSVNGLGSGADGVPMPVGADGEATHGTATPNATRCDHVHEHGSITTGGPYHMAEDVTFAPTGTIAATNVQAAIAEVALEATGAPTAADYLVGTAQAGLSAEIVVGATPGGELGGTWAAPTVDATHAGSTHSAASDTHVADTSAAHVASSIGFTPNGSIAATDVQAAIQEVRDEASGSALTVEDEGTPLATDATTLDFVGAGVVASGAGATKTITISGASVADILDLPTAETDDTLVLAPDGAGGVEFRAETGGSGAASPEWWHSDNAPGSPDAANREFTAALTDTRVAHGTPTGTWAQTFDGAEWTETATTNTDDLDVWYVARTMSVGDHVTLAFQASENWHGGANAIGAVVGFSNGSTFGTSNAIIGAGLVSSPFAIVANAYPGHNTRNADAALLQVGTGYNGHRWGMRIKYVAANTWGLYVRYPGGGWRTISTAIAYTMTPTGIVYGMGGLGGAAYSSTNPRVIRLESVRVND